MEGSVFNISKPYESRILILCDGFMEKNGTWSNDGKKFKNCLEYRGYNVLITSSCNKALYMLKYEPFDAIFLDYTMTTSNGKLFLEEYYDWITDNQSEYLTNIDILTIGISADNSLLECEVSMSLDNNKILSPRGPTSLGLSPRPDDTHLKNLETYPNTPRTPRGLDISLGHCSTSVAKSLAMIDLFVGNPMDNINMVIELLEEKQNHFTLPTLLDHLDQDPRYHRFRRATSSRHKVNKLEQKYSMTSTEITFPSTLLSLSYSSSSSPISSSTSSSPPPLLTTFHHQNHHQSDTNLDVSSRLKPKQSQVVEVTLKTPNTPTSYSSIVRNAINAITSPKWLRHRNVGISFNRRNMKSNNLSKVANPSRSVSIISPFSSNTNQSTRVHPSGLSH